MRCEDCRPLLEAFADGALGAADDSAVGAHLASCRACSEAVETLQEEQEMYAGYWREAGVTPPRWASVLAVIEQDRDSHAGSHATGRGEKWAALLDLWRLKTATATALASAGLVVGLLGFSQLTGRHTPRTERQEAGPRARAATADAATAPASGADLAVSGDEPGVRHADAKTRREATARGASSRSALRAADVRRPATGREAAAAVNTPARSSESAGPPPPVVEAARFERARLLGREMAAASAPPALGGSPGLTAEMSQHFERMELLFRSLKHAGRTGAGPTVDVTYEKGLSRRLLHRNVLLRREAESRGNLPLEEMLDSVEPVFAEIANLPAQAAPADLSLIGERVQKKGVVALLRAYLTPPAPEAVRDSF